MVGNQGKFGRYSLITRMETLFIDSLVLQLYYSNYKTWDLMMSNYENSKKARRIASVIYLFIMAVILGGTYLSNQQKEMAERASKESSQSMETPGGLSEIQVRN